MAGKVMVIGDVHGCIAELRFLLQKLDPDPKDKIVFLGDLINRGPDGPAVLDLAMQLGALCLMGNHERRIVLFLQTGQTDHLKEDDTRTISLLRKKHLKFLENLPLTHELPEWDTVLVHGGFLPQFPWREQSAAIVTRIQSVDRSGQPRKRAEQPDAPSWADLWRGPPFVIYGHTPRPKIYLSEWAMGIDTGCVMGGWLTGVVLPGREIVQVKAKQTYYSS